MINIKGKNDYLIALESVAMTDIVLNMFIFFFISFSLLYTFSPTKASKIDVRLPKASSAISLEGSEKLIVTITKDGKFFIDDEERTRKGVEASLKARLKDNPELGVILRVDSLAKFENVTEALDIINGLNIQKVSIATIKEN